MESDIRQKRSRALCGQMAVLRNRKNKKSSGGRGERCEVWMERASGRLEMWSEKSEEQE